MHPKDGLENSVDLDQEQSELVYAVCLNLGLLLFSLFSGGFLEDRLISKHDLQEIIRLPPIEQLHGELSGCLSLMGGGKTLSLLNSHQTNLSVNLGQYVKQSQEGENTW